MQVTDMRKLFPHPMTSQHHSKLECSGARPCDHYDVAGVYLSQNHGQRISFPTIFTVMRALKGDRRDLSLFDRLHIAKQICLLNDVGDFTGAWALLATVLGETL